MRIDMYSLEGRIQTIHCNCIVSILLAFYGGMYVLRNGYRILWIIPRFAIGKSADPACRAGSEACTYWVGYRIWR